jgi:hypothetical protein
VRQLPQKRRIRTNLKTSRSSVYFSESGLSNGLRPIGVKKISRLRIAPNRPGV